MQKQKQVENMPEVMPEIVQNEVEEAANDVHEIIEDLHSDYEIADDEEGNQEIHDEMLTEISEINEIETNISISPNTDKIIEQFLDCKASKYQKADNEQTRKSADAYDLKDFYTFVGNNDNEKDGTRNRASTLEIMKDKREEDKQKRVEC